MIATIALAATMGTVAVAELASTGRDTLTFMPLALSSIGLICSMIGIYSVKLFSSKSPEVALRIGTMGSSIIFIIAAYFLIA